MRFASGDDKLLGPTVQQQIHRGRRPGSMVTGLQHLDRERLVVGILEKREDGHLGVHVGVAATEVGHTNVLVRRARLPHQRGYDGHVVVDGGAPGVGPFKNGSESGWRLADLVLEAMDVSTDGNANEGRP